MILLYVGDSRQKKNKNRPANFFFRSVMLFKYSSIHSTPVVSFQEL